MREVTTNPYSSHARRRATAKPRLVLPEPGGAEHEQRPAGREGDVDGQLDVLGDDVLDVGPAVAERDRVGRALPVRRGRTCAGSRSSDGVQDLEDVVLVGGPDDHAEIVEQGGGVRVLGEGDEDDVGEDLGDALQQLGIAQVALEHDDQ